MEDLSTDEEDRVHSEMRQYEKKIGNLMNEVGTLKNEVHATKTIIHPFVNVFTQIQGVRVKQCYVFSVLYR